MTSRPTCNTRSVSQIEPTTAGARGMLPLEKGIAIVWPDLSGVPTHFANAFAVQLGAPAGDSGVPDGIHLLVGTLAPPLIVGTTPEELMASASKVDRIVVEPLARFVMSREHAINLRGFLDTVLKQYEAVRPSNVPS